MEADEIILKELLQDLKDRYDMTIKLVNQLMESVNHERERMAIDRACGSKKSDYFMSFMYPKTILKNIENIAREINIKCKAK